MIGSATRLRAILSISASLSIGVGLAAAGSFGRPGTVKMRVPHGALDAGLSPGQTLVADYGAFAIIEVAAGATAPDPSAELLPDENAILLNVGRLDTTLAAVRALQQPRGDFAGRQLHLVQFSGPVMPAWHDMLSATGVEIVTYIPSNAYLVYGDSAQLAALQAQAVTDPRVQWNGDYVSDYRIDPAARAVMAQADETTSHLFAIQLVQDEATNAQTLDLLNGLITGPVQQDYEVLNYHNIVAPLPALALESIAQQADVVYIHEYSTPQMHDERQDAIIINNLSGNNPAAPGYLEFLVNHGFDQSQFDASAFSVDVTDSGIDNGTISPNHFGLYSAGVKPGVSRIVYNRLVGQPNGGSTLKGCDGHGTINTHIVLGYNNLPAGFPHTDAEGFHYGLGVCPFTRAGSSVIFDPSWTSPNYTTLQSQAYRDSARFSTNSWGGTSSFGVYTIDSQTYDSLVRDAQPAGATVPAAGNQEMTIVFSAGNAGSGARTIGWPGTAKNVITVGAAEGVLAMGGTDKCGFGDTTSNSANDIASFSSRGPCNDNRKKPDIVAPGTRITGGVLQTASPGVNGTADPCFNGLYVCGAPQNSNFWPPGQQWYTASDGTSHSAPAVAGGAALTRQFFINLGMSAPSPAMIKAMLMNSTRYMTGSGANDTLWSASQGMGEMNLEALLRRGMTSPTVFRDEAADDLFTASGQTRVFTGSISNAAEPFRVTLAWSDAPGPTSGSAFKNDLDLTVTIGANTYKGNVFSGANSITGGATDAVDNVESVFLPAGTTGDFTVTVTAANINSDGVPNTGGALDQDFALVIYNGGGSSCIGDLDGSGAIDLTDLTIVLANYGSTTATPEQGDFDGDQDVDLSDLATFLSLYGTPCP